MEILNPAEVCFVANDDLLDFTVEDEAEEDDNRGTLLKGAFASASASSSLLTAAAAFSHETPNSTLFPEFVEEELEWLSNKDAFPSVDTCFGILSDNPGLILNHHSPVSVLENSAAAGGCSGVLRVPGKFPARPRSKRQRRKRDQQLWLNRLNVSVRSIMKGGRGSMGRRCLHCQSEKTPQWRAGPMGPKTLCNACGVRYKSGRLVPEYRPANSPTFSSAMHSNSHRKVVEMRRHKHLVSEACG